MGSPTVVYCTKCGTDLPEDSQFCRKCGHPVTIASQSSTNPVTPASPTIPAPTKSNRLQRIPLFLVLLVIVSLLGWFIDHQIQQSRQSRSENSSPVQNTVTPQTPPPPILHRGSIGNGAITVPAANYTYYTLTIPATATQVKLQGHFTATGGSGNDIEVYLLNQEQFTNWQNGHATPTFYNSGRVTVGDIDATLPNDEGVYYLIFNNKFSMITPKAVQEAVTLAYFTH